MSQHNKNLPSASTATLCIDQQQAQQQLKYLGYNTKNVFLRFFYHSDDPRKNGDKGRKLNHLRWQEIEAYQQDGRGVYVVVNGARGGHEDKEIKQCVAIFCEWDDRPLEEQLLHWEKVGFLEPTFTVYSGDKSAQPYWVFDTPITVEQWRELQCLLIDVMEADPSNKNPSRVFRLAGGWHVKPGREPRRTEIVQDSGKKYSYEQIRQELLRLQSGRQVDREQPVVLIELQKPKHSVGSVLIPQEQRYENIQIPVSPSVPLEICLSKHSRHLLTDGASKGCRNTSGAKLARDLIGTANHLIALGQSFEGNPRKLLEDYGNRCSPPLDQKEVETIWKSAEKDNPTPSCQAQGVVSCIRAWYWKHHIKPQAAGKTNERRLNPRTQTVTGDTTNSSDTSNAEPQSLSAIVTSVTQILEQGLPDWEEQAHLDALQHSSGISKASFAHLVASQRCQSDEVMLQDEQQLDRLIEWKNAKLDFNWVLPDFAEDLLHDARVLNIAPIMLWQYLLPATLSLVGKKVNLDAGSHTVPAIAWTCIVGESGIGKSRAESVILAPLRAWQQEEYHRFKPQWQEYKQSLNAKKNDSEPSEPPLPERKYLFEVATIQAVMRRLSEQGDNGSLWARDEIAGLFKSLGQFSAKGEGEGLECLLPMWDGTSAPVDRVMYEDSYHLDSSRLSIAGGLQPGVFRKIFSDPDDAQGLQARFLFALPAAQPAKIVEGYCRLSDKLPHFYRWVDTQFPAGNIKLSGAAKARYKVVYESMGRQALSATTPAVRAWMRKLPGQLLRIALALHVIECYHQPNRPRHELQLDTLNRAVDFCRYYRSTFEVVQESVSDSDCVSSILLKIWDAAATSPAGLAVRDAYRSIKALSRRAKEMGRNVAAYTIDLYYQLEKMGKGSVHKDGRVVRFVVGGAFPPSEPPEESRSNNPSDLQGGGGPTDGVTEVTEVERLAESRIEVSPLERVSPVTVQQIGQVDVDIHRTQVHDLPVLDAENRWEDIEDEDNEQPNTETQILSNIEKTAPSQELELVTHSVPIAPVAKADSQQDFAFQKLAEQILLCSTWVEIAQRVNQNGDALFAAAKKMTQQQREGLTRLLIEHLCQSPAHLGQLAWIPEKLRQQALKALTFTVGRIQDVAESVLDATWEVISGCRLKEISYLGTQYEMWIFTLPNGGNLGVYKEAVEAIACYEE